MTFHYLDKRKANDEVEDSKRVYVCNLQIKKKKNLTRLIILKIITINAIS